QLVHRTLSRPAEHAPVELESDACDPGGALDGSEADWDEQFKQNRRKQERIQRAIEERVGRGEDPEGAFRAAMGDEGIIDLPDERSEEDDDWDTESDEESTWKQDLFEPDSDEPSTADDSNPFEADRHPLQERAMDLMVQVHELFKGDAERVSRHVQVLQRGAG